MARPAIAQTGPKSGPEIEFSVRVREDGQTKFESAINAPLFADPDQQKAVTTAWMELMVAGLAFTRAMKGGKEEPSE